MIIQIIQIIQIILFYVTGKFGCRTDRSQLSLLWLAADRRRNDN